jgi:hypothetical protein
MHSYKLIAGLLFGCLLLLLLLQVEPRLAGGNAEIEGHIEHTLNPFREATSRPFLAAGMA